MDLEKKRNWFKLSFLFLLPLFFVFHGFTENFYAIPIGDILELFGIYFLASLFIFFVAWLLYKNVLKAAIFSFFLLGFNFFFGAIQDFLENIFDGIFFTRYSFLLPFFLISFISFTVYLSKTKKSFTRFAIYLNFLFAALILIDIVVLTNKTMRRVQPNEVASKYGMACNNCTKPDIYFLVFDEYSSTTALKETWNYDNSDLDTFLLQKKFRLLPYSRSNYNLTEFSIASMLNLEYLQIPDPLNCTIKDYNKCYELIKTNKVCAILNSMGYDIVNYSIFDLQKNPSPIQEVFLPLKTKLITTQTFLGRIKKDLLFHLLVGPFEIKWLSKNVIFSTYRNNQKLINIFLADTTNQVSNPRFIYTHIQMPHHPYYFDKNGMMRNTQDVIKESQTTSGYLDYLPETNKVIKQFVNSILSHAKRPVTIMLTSDHGLREHQKIDFQFRNLNAIYNSSGDYTRFNDSITNVNEFAILFNNLFKTSLPLKRDSTIPLNDKN